MARRMTWRQTVKTAKSDAVLVAIARTIREKNRTISAGGYAEKGVDYAAFRDRFAERGLSVPNEAYWDFVLVACMD